MTTRDLGLSDALEPHRAEALDRWQSLVFDSYSDEAVRFFRKERDGFKNPVGQSITRATGTLFDGVLMERGADGVPEALETIVRIRAVQDFSPAEAVGFVFLLKRAVREVIEGASSEGLPPSLRADLDARVDALALSAFEIYTRCREQIFEIRVREARRRSAALLERFSRDVPVDSPGDTSAGDGHPNQGVEV